MSEPLLTLAKVIKAYGAVQAVCGIDLSIDRGEFVAIMGPSGSGKSTLMNLLGTLDRPTSGTYRLVGDDVSTHGERELAHIRGRTIGFVFQGFNLLPRRSIIENIALPLLYTGMSRAESLARAEAYLEKVGLSTHRNYLPTQLSGGQQQRVAIARALATQPHLLLADEPTGNLDASTGSGVIDMLMQVVDEAKKTLIVVTHDTRIFEFADRIANYRAGVKVAEDAQDYVTAELFKELLAEIDAESR